MQKLLVWGDVDATWHYRQTAIDTAGPAKDRSQKQWTGAATYGLAGLNVRQLTCLKVSVAHGLPFDRELSALERNRSLPVFGYSLDDQTPKTFKKRDEKVLRVKEPYGWTSCDWNEYRKLTRDIWERAQSELDGEPPSAILLNDAGWGCLRRYFDNREEVPPSNKTYHGQLRDWLKSHLPTVPVEGVPIIVKTRIYPPINYEDPQYRFAPYSSRNKTHNLKIDPRLVLTVNVGDLRLLGINISRGISWERTVQHLLEAANQGFLEAKQIVGIREARFIVVLFGSDGIVLLDRSKDGSALVATLVFHGPDIEGDSDNRMTGRAYGATTWVSSILASLLSRNPSILDDRESNSLHDWWKDSLRLCLAYVRHLNREGNSPIPIEAVAPGYASFGPIPKESKASRKSGERNQGPIYPGWGVVNLEGMGAVDVSDLVGQFEAWHTYRSELRKYSRNRRMARGVGSKQKLRAWRFEEAQRGTFEKLEAFIDRERLRYCYVSQAELQKLKPLKTPPLIPYKRDGYPDGFKQTWWSFLAIELNRRSNWETGTESAKLAKACVRYAVELLRYGGWDKEEYFPYTVTVPFVEFGKLRSCDRAEIEGLRNFSAIISEYLRRDVQDPLNVAVFGPAGAGKSFAVRQVIEAISHQREPSFLTFNLSQFQSPSQLPACYQLIQNEVLKGRLPVVFWDEFDTTLNEVSFGWLSSFLAPMQDGIFIHEQRENKIGKCVFVFAGSRFDRFADLPAPSDSIEKARPEIVTMSFREVAERSQFEDLSTPSSPETRRQELINLRKRQEDWRVAKGNDFRSRLKGYLDVQDCNLQTSPWDKRIPVITPNDPATCDQLNFLMRRARMVRDTLLKLEELFVLSEYPKSSHIETDKESGLWSKEPLDGITSSKYLELKISNEIAFGLLTPYPFTHGMRSLRAILETCELTSKTRFERAFILTAEMLGVHVRPDAFEFGSGGQSFESYLKDWANKYFEIVRPQESLGIPLVDWTTASVRFNDATRQFPCLVYGERMFDGMKDVILSELDERDHPDRLEILVSTDNDVQRPETWATVAFDRGSPYVLNAERFMLDRLGIRGTEDVRITVYVACRWWRRQECGGLSESKAITLRKFGGDIEFIWPDPM